MHNRIFRKFFAVLLSLMMILSMSIASFADMLDVSNHWAKNEIEYLTSKGVISGYPSGEFKPDKTITRAEFFKIINKVFGYSDKAEISFSDVKNTDWYYGEIQKAVEAGYVNGYPDNTIRPNGEITRQEAAKVMAIAFGLDEEKSYSWAIFNDNSSIATWAQNYVGVICDKGFVSGYTDGTFKPENKLTRAEAVKMISNAASALYNVSGSYTENVNGNVVVNTTDVTLKDMTINGDLYLAEGIGDGDVTLDGVTVKGKTFVRGGGENSIHINNSSLGEIKVAKTKKNVRIVLSGEITIPNLTVDENTIVVIGEGVTIENLQINGQANIELAEGATIENAVVNAPDVEITGEGNIESLQANEDVVVNGEEVEKGEEIAIEEGKEANEEEKSSGGSSSSGGGSTPSEEVKVTGVTLNEKSAVLTVGETLQLEATVEPSNADNKAITWSSSDESIATVSSDGLVTAVAPGEATIKVTTKDGGKTATCLVVVIPESPTIVPLGKQTDDRWHNGVLTQEELDSITGEHRSIILDIELPDSAGTGYDEDGNRAGYWIELHFIDSNGEKVYGTNSPIHEGEKEDGLKTKSISVEDLEERFKNGETYSMYASIVYIEDGQEFESDSSEEVKVQYNE